MKCHDVLSVRYLLLNNMLNKDTTMVHNNIGIEHYVRVFQSKELYAVMTQKGQWYVINSKKNKYNGKYFNKLPFRSSTVMLIPLYMIDSIFPRLKDKLVLTSWLLGLLRQ